MGVMGLFNWSLTWVEPYHLLEKPPTRASKKWPSCRSSNSFGCLALKSPTRDSRRWPSCRISRGFHATKVTDEGLKEVAKLQMLQQLYLPSQITDAGLKEVAKLRYLTSLGLSGTKITDAGLKEVAKLQKLRFLDLSYTRITGAGVAKLKKALSPYCRIIR